MYNISNDFITKIGIAGKEKDVCIVKGQEQIIPQTFKHSFSGDIFTSIMQKTEIEVKNGSILTEGTILKPKYGLKVGTTYEYIDYSDYNVYTSEINYDTNIVRTVAYDNLIKFMVKYDASKLNLTYPITILNLIQAICNYIGVQLYSTDFFNANLTIEVDLFTALNCTYRDVINYICQATLTTAIIKNNKLYFKNTTETNKTIIPQILKKFKIKSHFGGCNSLVLGRGDLNDNIFSKDDDLILADGLQEIRFDNNEILDKKREQVIDSMFNQIKGFSYNSFEAKDLGIGIFEPADFCDMQDLSGNNYKVLILNQSISVTSGTEGAMSSEVPSTSTTKYEYATDSQKRQSKTEIIVNKQEQEITAVVEQIGDRSDKSTTITQDIDSIQSKINNIQDLTREITGVKTITLENAMEGELLSLRIKGNNTIFGYLYPADSLYPADNLYPKRR